MSEQHPVSVEDQTRIEAVFTSIVDHSRTFPDPLLAELGNNIWDVFHYRHARLALGPEVPSLSFAVLQKAGVLMAVVFAPHNWLELVEKDKILQLGAILFVGSQAVDYYNGRLDLDGHKGVIRRAQSYEAQYLKTVPDTYELNEYHQELLKRFPDGFDPELRYASKPGWLSQGLGTPLEADWQ